MMRLMVGVLASTSVGVLSLALADPPQPSAAQSPTAAATAAAPAPAATAPPAAIPPTAASLPSTAKSSKAPAPAELDQKEKHLLAEGYTVEVHRGRRLFCHREEMLGSRLGGGKTCATAQELEDRETQSREAVERVQRLTMPPSGK